ncbi:CoA-disulfide reductase [Proteinivorax hydrogeniformans]|uniref:CoA-disulfide reductase n=1 Tax=Proteinivorax hydrogeniformans TaxID=1826727 RepID=A0AAU8HVD4_9FIRM
MKLVVIGAVAAGLSAASKAKREKPELEIEVYTSEEHISYGACGLPYYIEEKIGSSEKLIARTKEEFKKQGIKVVTKSLVEQINPEEKTILVKDLDNDENKTVNFDSLLIATGASPIMPPLDGINLDNIFTVKNIPDADKIKKQIPNTKKVVIVGGGYIGLEMVEAFYAHGLDITVIEMAPQLMGNIDSDMAGVIAEHLKEKGVNVCSGEKVESFQGEKAVESVKTDKGTYHADMVIMAIGVSPNSQLAKNAGIKLGVKNSIKTNRKMETSVKDIYAAGDCTAAYHLLYEDDAYIPLGTTANKQGRLAGENIAGGNSHFQGIIGTGIMKVLDLEVGRTGLNTREAKQLEKDFYETVITIPNIAGYYPGHGKGKMKLIVEKGSGKVLGCQLVGPKGIAKRIDTVAACIHNENTIWDMAKLDLAYAPPFSPVWDPVLMAANVAINKFKK